MSKNNITRRGFVLKSAVSIGGLPVAGYSTVAAVIENKIKKDRQKRGEASKSKSIVTEENDVIIENDDEG